METYKQNRSWDTAYLLGIPEIDRQHEKIFDIYDQIVNMSDLQEKYQDDEMKNILHELEDYLKIHFKSEEALLHKANYPNIEEHIIEHEMFIKKVDEFVLGYQANSPILLNNMLDFLKKWLVSHIMVTDYVYKDHLAADVN